MQHTLRSIAHLFGFEKLGQYEQDYLHDANLHGSLYIGIITIVLEVWMLIRRSYTRVLPKCQEGMDLFTALVKYTSKYWLFLLTGLGLAVFCMFAMNYKNSRMNKRWFATLFAIGAISIIYTSLLRLEEFTQVGESVTPTMATIMNVMLVTIYVCLFISGMVMILYALFHFFLNKRIILLERIMIVNFAVIGVAFGIFVSYSDFWGGKEIICFMMMMIYVGYLTIYRPYITVLILSSCFFAFYNILLTYEGGLTFKPKEVVINGVTHIITSGDTANYLTYLASLITICIAMYHGRLKEANESRRIYRLFGQTAEALAAAIDTKDKYTHGHSQRVADYSLKIARAAGKSEEDCQQVYYAALLHDVGKIGVPDQIINKEGALTDEEFAEIKKHPVHGNNILSRINESPYLSIGAHYHHERYDGRGYPTGLKGEDIPEIARIIAVADAYDAMTSKRSYREPLPQQKVREEVYKGIGTQFDPEFARLMINLIDEDTSYLMQESDQQTEDGVSTRLTCGNLYNDCTEGTQLVDQILQMRFYSKAQDGFSERESIPSLVLFDSLDKRIHLSERGKKDFMYYEYARIRMDGEVVSEGTRNVEKKRIKGANAEGEADAYTKERGVRYDVRAFRIEDHVQIRIESKYQTVEITLALPDSVRFSYLAITGSHCEIFNIKMKQEEDAVAEDQITRIAPRISYIDDAPVGDVPNVQINGWREKTTEGILLKEGKTIISFHSRSLPMAWLIWHCPFILLFTSEDASVSGDQFREFGVIRLDGETWMSDEHAENIIETDQTKDFKGWNEWREKNKEGIDITVTLTRNGNTIITETENLGLSLHTTTIVRDETENIYAAITGDICAITDIHVTNSMS